MGDGAVVRWVDLAEEEVVVVVALHFSRCRWFACI